MGRNGKKEKKAKEEEGKDCRKEGREEDEGGERKCNTVFSALSSYCNCLVLVLQSI